MLAFMRGFVREALGMTAWAGAAYVSYIGIDYVRIQVRDLVGNPEMGDIVAHAGLFLAHEGFELAIEFGDEPAGLGVFRDGFGGGAIALEGRVFLDHLPDFFGGVENGLRVGGHLRSSGVIVRVTMGHYNRGGPAVQCGELAMVVHQRVDPGRCFGRSPCTLPRLIEFETL